MIRLKYPVIVEGKYDKMKLRGMVEGEIITTEGFRIFRDKDKLTLIRRLAAAGKVVLLTDSDRAGFRIRGYLSGAIPPERIIQVYIPEILGKERRKAAPSEEGTLGVEGMPEEVLRRALEQAGALEDGNAPPVREPITKQDLFALGLSGGPDSSTLRRLVQRELGLPGAISANALCGVLSRVVTREELAQAVARVKQQLEET